MMFAYSAIDAKAYAPRGTRTLSTLDAAQWMEVLPEKGIH
jgi:hypothetical protein